MRFAARRAHGKYGPDATPALCIPGSDTEGVTTSLGVEPLCRWTGSLMNVGIHPDQPGAAPVSAVSWLSVHLAIYQYGGGLRSSVPSSTGCRSCSVQTLRYAAPSGKPGGVGLRAVFRSIAGVAAAARKTGYLTVGRVGPASCGTACAACPLRSATT
ncbi:hypothetical protein K438DRAFT_1987835 [Mycena galopus ATCC 62051]|nr:hypothetical protein K438DRAFT_1987835 [Mycena galopus ATCC 62051]